MCDLTGIKSVEKAMQNLLENKEVYMSRTASLPNFIITYEGYGQTYITEVITDTFSDNNLRDFKAIDEHLEYIVDGSLSYIKWMFSDINDNSVYDNVYKGVVSVDVSKLVNYQNEYQMEYFENNLKKIAKGATIIVFCNTKTGKNGDRLVARMKEVLEKFIEISFDKMSPFDYANLITQDLLNRGVDIQDKDSVIEVLNNTVAKNICSVKAAIDIVDRLVFCVDYTNNPPILTLNGVKSFRDKCKEEN